MLLSSLFSLIFPSLKSFPLFFLSPFQFLSLFPLFLPLPSFLSSHLSISLSLSHLLLFLIPVTSVLLVVSVSSCLSLNPFFLVVLFCRSLSDLFLYIPSLFSLFRFLNVPSPTHLIPFSLLSSNAPLFCPPIYSSLPLFLFSLPPSPSLPLSHYLLRPCSLSARGAPIRCKQMIRCCPLTKSILIIMTGCTLCSVAAGW